MSWPNEDYPGKYENTNAVIVSQSACETIYKVENKHNLRVFAIVGGQMAISFEDYYFTKRYNICDKYTSDKWDGKKYINNNIPSAEDLPEGFYTLKLYHVHNIFRYERQKAREKILHDHFDYRLLSQRFHDKEKRQYYQIEIELQRIAFTRPMALCKWGNVNLHKFPNIVQEYYKLIEQYNKDWIPYCDIPDDNWMKIFYKLVQVADSKYFKGNKK